MHLIARNIIFVLLLTVCSTCIFAQKTALFDLRRNKEPKTWEELTDKITSGISDDSIKVLAIYRWITENISYDYNSFMSGQPIRHQSPERVYMRRSTTCTGYANLMVSMLNRSGVAAVDVGGFTHDFTLGIDSTKLNADHAWVAFKCQGKWLLADPTWDAGYVGIYAFTKEERIKTPFFTWFKKFRIKNIFQKGKQNPRYRVKRTVIYKEGFLSDPQQNFIFIPAETFLKTHLPNVAHLQFMHDPVTVEQFCDSTHSLGAYHYSNRGSFNYPGLTDSYAALDERERLLWIADSALLYNALNHADKAINTHNYLANFYGERSIEKGILERFISLADSVILHAPAAIRINREELSKKRKLLSNSFHVERSQYNAQALQLNRMKGHLSRSLEIYRKGLERINSKELVYLDKSSIQFPEGESSKISDTIWYPKDAKYRNELNRIRLLFDSLTVFQQKEMNKYAEPYRHFDSLLLLTVQAMDTHFIVLQEGEFLNQWKVRWSDGQLTKSLSSLNGFVADSINTILGPRSSWSYLLKLDREIKRQRSMWTEWEKKDSSLQSAELIDLTNSLFSERLKLEGAIIYKRLLIFKKMKAYHKEMLNNIKSLNTAYSKLNRLRILRQNYLNKMLNSKYKRSALVCQSILTNAKNWKKNYQSRLKLLQSGNE